MKYALQLAAAVALLVAAFMVTGVVKVQVNQAPTPTVHRVSQ
ncbi:MAG TPA: hypothetical protein VM471_10975 [Phenylobacterium sp.]|nr:hypothetical protein [Phenylobacterium sp.]